jgi:hypothetical protein
MRWVTRKGVRLDRSACAWLIKRHLDPSAFISYVDAEKIADEVEEGALPFHNTVSEEPGTRERTSFQELLAEYRLDDNNKALELMGEIVRGAETKEPGSIEEGEGLRAIAKGMNALVKSDTEMVDSMIPIFDALYQYCVRRTEGHRGWANAESDWGKERNSVSMRSSQNPG